MDARQPAQEYAGGNPQRTPGSYAFNGAQNDPFNSFVNTENESAFEPSWGSQTLPTQQQHVNGFNQPNHSWQQNTYHPSSFLGASNFGAPPRDYDQQYSRSPSSFGYSGFDPTQSQTFPPNAYETPPLSYDNPPYNSIDNISQLEYPGATVLQPHHETISPQELQNYSSSFPQSAIDDSSQSQHARYGGTLPMKGVSSTGAPPYNGPDWARLASKTSASIAARGLHIKPTDRLASATKSTRVDGFVFVGDSAQGSNVIKAKIARNDRKRSLKAIRRLFEIEKGSDAWPHERGHLMKKLKLTESKLGSRPVKAPSHSRTGSADSASPTESSDSESEDDSAEYSESDLEPEPEEQSPLPLTRPADPNKAVEYDVIKAVWAKKNVGLSGVVIRSALTEFWEVFKGIRDKWKAKATSLQQAIEKKDQANIKAYERRVVEQRRLLQSCIGLTLKYGHPNIIEKIGENPAFILVFYQFLADRFKDSEFTGSLIANILELLTRCITIDQPMLERTKMDKVLGRIVKRGDDQGKAFVQKILDHAAALSKQKTVGGKVTQTPPASGAVLKSLTNVKEIKRERPDEAQKNSNVTAKGSHPIKTAKAGSLSDARQITVKAEPKSNVKTAGADTPATKIKANAVTAKPTGFFAGLKSASKKPGTSAKSEEGKISTMSDIKAEPTAALPKSGFSFAATMAALDAQKEAPPVKVQETRKPETAEEKKKRLRKEERRKLRVSFKAEEDLVQIREFSHDPEEELGHEDSQVRDVKDARGEGQMLKMHKDLDMDDDEDYEPPEEIVLPEWTSPQPIDFSVIEKQELDRNYASRGGEKTVESQERVLQEQRELSTLMVVYPTQMDIPSSPREPSNPFAGEPVEEISFGIPSDDTKKREAEYIAKRNPPMPDIASLLRIMGQASVQPQPQAPPQQPPQQMVAPSTTPLEAIFAQFGNSNQQQAPLMQIPPQQPAPTYDLQAALAGIQQPPPPQTGYVAPPPPQVNIQALLAQMGNQAAPQVPQMQGYNYGDQSQIDNDRKRQFEQDDGDYGRKRARGEARPLPYKTKICMYWKDGRCRRGDECSYLHE